MIRNAVDLQCVQRRLGEIYGNTERLMESVFEVKGACVMIDSKVDKLNALLLEHARAHSASILPSAEMPPPPSIFYGRAHLVEEIALLLTSGERSRSWIAILGPGGIGKTSVALAIMEHQLVKNYFSKVNTFWVPCVGATTPSALLQHLYLCLRITRDTNNPLADILYELKSSQEPRVILLDNFETPWHPIEGNQSQVIEILHTLHTLPHVSILLTMRSQFSPCEDNILWETRKLGAIDLELSRQVYTKIDPSASDCKHLDDLLHSLGHLPFAVTLMAKLGKRSDTRPEVLLQEWKQIGTNMLSDPETGLNHCISLSVDSNFIQNIPEALTLLCTLSLLPAGTERRNLSWWAPGLRNVSNAITTLREMSLIHPMTRLFVLPVVQSFMQQTNHVSESVRKSVESACFDFLRSHNSTPNPGYASFKEDIRMIAEEEMNIEAILQASRKVTEAELEATNTDLLDALISFSWYQCWSKPRTDIIEQAAILAQRSGDSRRHAGALFCLGTILFRMDKYLEAKDRFMEAHELFSSLADGVDYFNSARSKLQAAKVHIYLNSSRQSIWQLVDDARKDFERSNNPIGKAYSLLALGEFHWYKRDPDEAIAVLENAYKAFDDLGQPLETAHCLFLLSRSHGAKYQYDKALTIIEDVIHRYDQLGNEDRYCESWLVKVRCLKHLKCTGSADDSELVLFESALRFALEKIQHLGRPIATARILDEYGEMYVKMGDFVAARISYEGALKEYRSLSGEMAASAVKKCESNLQYLTQKEAGNDLPELFLTSRGI